MNSFQISSCVTEGGWGVEESRPDSDLRMCELCFTDDSGVTKGVM